MIDAFNGPIFLILFIINFLGGAYYAYQALFTSEKFCDQYGICLLYTSPSPRDLSTSRMPSSA